MDLPLGMYPSRLDDKGRIKMPATFFQYLSSLSDTRLFVTSIDRRIAQIYPVQVWRDNQKFLETYADAKAARRIEFNAADLGVEAEMDAQGRITFPTELRRQLLLEDQTLRLQAHRSHIQVLSEREYEALKRDGGTLTADEVDRAEAGGLK